MDAGERPAPPVSDLSSTRGRGPGWFATWYANLMLTIIALAAIPLAAATVGTAYLAFKYQDRAQAIWEVLSGDRSVLDGASHTHGTVGAPNSSHPDDYEPAYDELQKRLLDDAVGRLNRSDGREMPPVDDLTGDVPTLAEKKRQDNN